MIPWGPLEMDMQLKMNARLEINVWSNDSSIPRIIFFSDILVIGSEKPTAGHLTSQAFFKGPTFFNLLKLNRTSGKAFRLNKSQWKKFNNPYFSYIWIGDLQKN